MLLKIAVIFLGLAALHWTSDAARTYIPLAARSASLVEAQTNPTATPSALVVPTNGNGREGSLVLTADVVLCSSTRGFGGTYVCLIPRLTVGGVQATGWVTVWWYIGERGFRVFEVTLSRSRELFSIQPGDRGKTLVLDIEGTLVGGQTVKLTRHIDIR